MAGKFYADMSRFRCGQCSRNCYSSGGRFHWAITSYATEFCAALIAFFHSSGPLHIRSDCKTMVEHMQAMIHTEAIDVSWPLSHWWKTFHQVWIDRKSLCAEPLFVTWVPAHKLEHIPEHLIDDDMARANHSTVRDIVLNRKANHSAKTAALNNSLIDPDMHPSLCNAIQERHEWSAQLSRLCGQETHVFSEETDDERVEENQSPRVLFLHLP